MSLPERITNRFQVEVKLRKFHLPSKTRALIANEILPQIPKEDRKEFLEDDIDSTLANNISFAMLQATARHVLPRIPPDYRRNVFLHGLRMTFLKKMPLSPEKIKEQGDLAEQYLKMFGSSDYFSRIVSENIGMLADLRTGVNRLYLADHKMFGQGHIIPLGGKLAGYLIRVTTKSAFDAWRRAAEAGISTEPILRDKLGRYRVHNFKDSKDYVYVYTKFVGEVLPDFIRQHPELESEVLKQKEQIISQLNQHKIFHGDMHSGNFTVELADGKPRVYIIDWDYDR